MIPGFFVWFFVWFFCEACATSRIWYACSKWTAAEKQNAEQQPRKVLKMKVLKMKVLK